jgi:hypothetical protein
MRNLLVVFAIATLVITVCPTKGLTASPPAAADLDAAKAALGELPRVLASKPVAERITFLKEMAKRIKPVKGTTTLRSDDGSVEFVVAADNESIIGWKATATTMTVLVAGDGINGRPRPIDARQGGDVHLASMAPGSVVYAIAGDGSPVGGIGFASFGAGGGGGGVVLSGTKPCLEPPFSRGWVSVNMNEANPRWGGGRGSAVVFHLPELDIGGQFPLTLKTAELVLSEAFMQFVNGLDDELPGIVALDSHDAVGIAKALAKRKGPLVLPNLKKISPKTLTALLKKEDVEIPLIETLELIQEPDGSVTEDFLIPEGFQKGRQRQSK